MIVGLMQNEKSIIKLSQKWKILSFNEVIKDSSGRNKKIKTNDTLEIGKIPVIDQGKDFIAGYTNIEDSIVKAKKPLIIFGDHTRILKYIDFDFAMGADGTKVLEIINDEAFPKFIYYYLSSIDIINTGYNRHFKYVKDLVFPLPPLETQKRIAQILDDAAALRDKTEQLLKEYDALAQSIFLDMFGDPVRNEKGWKTKTIEKLVINEKGSIKRGPFGGALKKEIFVEDGYLVYEQFHALNNDFSMERYYIDEKKFNELRGFEVKPGDIIISCSGVYLGKLALVPENAKKGIINQALLKVTIDEKVMRKDFFIFHFSHRNFRQKYFDANRGAGIPNFPPMSEFKKFPFLSPPIELQSQFAAKITLIEKQKELAKQELKESQHLFNCLLQKAFKGELV